MIHQHRCMHHLSPKNAFQLSHLQSFDTIWKPFYGHLLAPSRSHSRLGRGTFPNSVDVGLNAFTRHQHCSTTFYQWNTFKQKLKRHVLVRTINIMRRRCGVPVILQQSHNCQRLTYLIQLQTTRHSVECIPPPRHTEIGTVLLLASSRYISLDFLHTTP